VFRIRQLGSNTTLELIQERLDLQRIEVLGEVQVDVDQDGRRA
jgi:hypothetical protein